MKRIQWIELTPAHVYFREHKPGREDSGWRWRQDNLFYGDWTRPNLPGAMYPKTWDTCGYTSMDCVLT